MNDSGHGAPRPDLHSWACAHARAREKSLKNFRQNLRLIDKTRSGFFAALDRRVATCRSASGGRRRHSEGSKHGVISIDRMLGWAQDGDPICAAAPFP
jgi:hypothetical protein